MKIKYLFHTALYLRPIQIIYQLKNRIWTYNYEENHFNKEIEGCKYDDFIYKYESFNNGSFNFLNLTSIFKSWNDETNGRLWVYNLNYMDWLLQKKMNFEEGAKWINKFIDEISTNDVGLYPYPISLRGINWIKFISIYRDRINNDMLKKWNDSLYSQYLLLLKKLEYHLLGNHLLENAFSLFIASIYFRELNLFHFSSALLKKELKEQILPDGANFEQSPMYHCILLDRLLDCYNLSKNNIFTDAQINFNKFLKTKSELMIGHLLSIVNSDFSIPLMNDSSNGIAPTAKELLEYGKRLDLWCNAVPLNECGYRRFVNRKFESIVDIGEISAYYQPAHSHADTFNYILSINGFSFIIDTGLSTYNKTERRQYERSTAAHNTVTVNDKNSSEVWGGFRVGKRAKVSILKENYQSIVASHDGFGEKYIHTRKFVISSDCFEISDEISNFANSVSFIHFAPEVKVLSFDNLTIITNIAKISIEGASKIEITYNFISTEYNRLKKIQVAKIYFSKKLKQIIS